MRALYCIEYEVPGTLDKLSKVKKNTKRIVSRDPKDLFEQKALVDKYAEELVTASLWGSTTVKRRSSVG